MTESTDILSGAVCSLLRDRAEILRAQPMLIALCDRDGCSGSMDYLDYFLHIPANLNKIPCLVLLSRNGGSPLEMDVDDLLGAVILYEYSLKGVGLRVFITEDFTGRRTVIAPAKDRPLMIVKACEYVMEQGAEVVLVNVSNEPRHEYGAVLAREANGRSKRLWAVNRRMVRTYLYLKETYDETLLQMGKHTRRNMRYYRRRAEGELQCCYVADAMHSIPAGEMSALNRTSTHPIEEDAQMLRFKTLIGLSGSFLAGVQAGNGDWLSVMAGRRYNGMAEVDWQINRAGYEKYSIGTVMRSYFIQDAIARKTERIYFEGGTPHSMQQAFAEEEVVDVMVMRRSIFTALLRRFGRMFFPEKNFLTQLLADSTIQWRLR